MNNFGNIANAMASMQVNEEAAYAVPKDTVGKGNEYAQPVLDKPPGGGKSKLRKQREQQLAMQKGNYSLTLLNNISPSVLFLSLFLFLSIIYEYRPRNELTVLSARFSAPRMVCRGRLRLREHQLERRAPQLVVGRFLGHTRRRRRGQEGAALSPPPQEAASAAAPGTASAVGRGPGGLAKSPRADSQGPTAAIKRKIVTARQRKR